MTTNKDIESQNKTCEFCESWTYLYQGLYRCGHECAEFVAKYGSNDTTAKDDLISRREVVERLREVATDADKYATSVHWRRKQAYGIAASDLAGVVKHEINALADEFSKADQVEMKPSTPIATIEVCQDNSGLDAVAPDVLRSEIVRLQDERNQLATMGADYHDALRAVQSATSCPVCPNVGYYAEGPTDAPEQVQCEWCWTTETSMFNARVKVDVALASKPDTKSSEASHHRDVSQGGPASLNESSSATPSPVHEDVLQVELFTRILRCVAEVYGVDATDYSTIQFKGKQYRISEVSANTRVTTPVVRGETELEESLRIENQSLRAELGQVYGRELRGESQAQRAAEQIGITIAPHLSCEVSLKALEREFAVIIVSLSTPVGKIPLPDNYICVAPDEPITGAHLGVCLRCQEGLASLRTASRSTEAVAHEVANTVVQYFNPLAPESEALTETISHVAAIVAQYLTGRDSWDKAIDVMKKCFPDERLVRFSTVRAALEAARDRSRTASSDEVVGVVEIEFQEVAEAARDFIWEGEAWESYQDSLKSNSLSWPPEFLLLAEAVARKFGQPTVSSGEGK